jgi:RNA polymerase sigma-70 factor (ECF subfamily)
MTDTADPAAATPDEVMVGLIAQAQRRLYAFILTLVRREADADDVLQETNAVLWRKRAIFQRESDFMAWAFEIARFQVLAWRGRQARGADLFEPALLAEIAATALAESVEYSRRENALAGCLKKLPENQRGLILRRYQPRVAVKSMAAEMGKSAKALSESLRRIRDTLRECVERALAAESSG